MQREALVGFVFVMAVVVFAVFALYAGGLEQVGAARQPLETTFPNVSGLEVDDPVSLAGVEIGRVERMWVDRDRVRVRMQVDTDAGVRADSTARLETESLLGGRRIDISLGSPAEPAVQPGASIPGEISTDIDQLVDSVGQMTKDVQGLVVDFRQNQNDVFARLGTTVDEAHETFATINRILGENEEGLTEAVASLADIGPRMETTLARLDEITAQVQSGEGTLGRLVYDGALYDELLQLSQSMNASAGKLAESLDKYGDDIGEAMGAFAEAGPQLRDTMARIDRITAKIEAGEGTLGKLVNDEQLYVEATRALQAVGDAAENAREQGPISTFTGALVGAATALN